MYDFRRITLFCLEKRILMRKMTIFSKILGGPWLLCPIGYDYETHIECIYFCKWVAIGLSIAFIAAFSLESNIELKIIIKQ